MENYNDFAAAMMQLGLIGIRNQRPLLDGGEIAGDATVLPNVPRGAEFRRVMEAQTRWLTSHPGGRRGALVERLRSAFCYESSNNNLKEIRFSLLQSMTYRTIMMKLG